MRRLTIGQVLDALRGEGVTASKLRFWEEQGLIRPERTPAGYRQFTSDDVERLRLICALQRERHMPLQAIAKYLDDADRGLVPVASPGDALAPPAFGLPPGEAERFTRGKSLRLTRAELLAAADITEEFFDELLEYSLLDRGEETFDEDAAVIAGTAATLARQGIEPRHLRRFRTRAESDFALIEPSLAPLLAKKTPTARRAAADLAAEAAAAVMALQAALLSREIHRADD